MSLEVKAGDWVRAARERFDWGVYERRVYAKDVEPVGFKKTKEFETFERLTFKGGRFEYAVRIVDPEVVLERARARPVKLSPPEEILRADRLFRVREVEVARPIPGLPGVTALAHIVKPQAEAILEKIKPSTPTVPNIVEVSKLRELPVRADIDAIGHLVEPNVRLGVQLPAPGSWV
jgi:hypothetical protein